MLPIAFVAAFSYGHITRELRSQSERRLEQANKAMGLALYERLLLLDATLKSIPPGVVHQLHTVGGASNHLLNAGVDLLAGRRFAALEFEGDDGQRIAVFGRMDVRPSLSAADRESLSAGLPLIVAVYIDSVSARKIGRAHV